MEVFWGVECYGGVLGSWVRWRCFGELSAMELFWGVECYGGVLGSCVLWGCFGELSAIKVFWGVECYGGVLGSWVLWRCFGELSSIKVFWGVECYGGVLGSWVLYNCFGELSAMRVFWGAECYRGVLGSWVLWVCFGELSAIKVFWGVQCTLVGWRLPAAYTHSTSRGVHEACYWHAQRSIPTAALHTHFVHIPFLTCIPADPADDMSHIQTIIKSASKPFQSWQHTGYHIVSPNSCSCLLGYLVNFILLWAAQTHTRISVHSQESFCWTVIPLAIWDKEKSPEFNCVDFLDLFYIFSPLNILCYNCLHWYYAHFFCWLSVLLVIILVPVALVYVIGQLFSLIVYLIWSFYSSLQNENKWCNLFWYVLSYFLVLLMLCMSQSYDLICFAQNGEVYLHHDIYWLYW